MIAWEEISTNHWVLIIQKNDDSRVVASVRVEMWKDTINRRGIPYKTPKFRYDPPWCGYADHFPTCRAKTLDGAKKEVVRKCMQYYERQAALYEAMTEAGIK